MNTSLLHIQPQAALHPTIKAGGVQGFIAWMKSDPVMSKIYARIAPQVSQLNAASGLSGLRGAMFDEQFGALGDDYAASEISAFAPSTDYASSEVSAFSAPATPAPSSWSDSISKLISGVGAGLLTAQQLITTNKVVNAQLAQAQAGRAPLNLSAYGLSTTPGFNLGLSSGTQNTMLMLGAGLLGVILVSSLLKHRRN